MEEVRRATMVEVQLEPEMEARAERSLLKPDKKVRAHLPLLSGAN